MLGLLEEHMFGTVFRREVGRYLFSILPVQSCTIPNISELFSSTKVNDEDYGQNEPEKSNTEEVPVQTFKTADTKHDFLHDLAVLMITMSANTFIKQIQQNTLVGNT